MSLEFVREAIRVSQVIGEDSTQTVVENDIIVPDVKPDIAHILLLDGDVYTNKTEAMHDKILVSGTIMFKILYIPDDSSQSLKGINTSMPFSYGLDMNGSKQGMNCRIKCDIEHIEYEILNGRKINVKTILNVGGKVYDGVDQDVIGGIKGIDDIQVMKENLKINCHIGNNESLCNVRETLEVPSGKPPIKEILRNDIKILGKDFKVTDNKVLVKGDLNVTTLYIGDDEDRSIQVMEHEIPFTQFVDLYGIDEGSTCDVDSNIINSQFDVVEDNEGESRALNCEVSINIYVEGNAKRNIETIVDAYSSRAKLSFEKENFTTEEILSQSRSQIILKDTLTLKEGNPDLGEVFNVLCKPILSECRIGEDKVVVEGLTNNSVLYLSNDSEQPICCHVEEIPFRHSVDVKGINDEMPCEIDLDIEHCNYSVVSNNEVEVRLVINLNIKVLNQISIPLIVKVNEGLIDANKLSSQPSIIIYFTKQGDTLWNIAKKYLTTVMDLQTVNNMIDSDAVIPGQQLIIPKRVV